MSAQTLQLIELYRSLQGESTFAGEPCIFVRTAGCNLRCTWCDSVYTFQGGTEWGLSAILDEVDRLGSGHVEITGGEPLLQPAVHLLMARLLDRGRVVLLETSGSLPLSEVPEGVIKIMDLKAPSSGEESRNHWPNLELLGPRDEVKIVLTGREDYLWARQMAKDHDLPGRCRALLLSPAMGELEPARLAGWILEDGLVARLNLQWHKFLWPDQTQGV